MSWKFTSELYAEAGFEPGKVEKSRNLRAAFCTGTATPDQLAEYAQYSDKWNEYSRLTIERDQADARERAAPDPARHDADPDGGLPGASGRPSRATPDRSSATNDRGKRWNRIADGCSRVADVLRFSGKRWRRTHHGRSQLQHEALIVQRLWVAVLALAIDDALGRSSFNAVNYRRDGDPRPAARRWFEQGDPDFEAVAALAGIDDADGLRHAVLTGRVGELNLGMGRPKRRTPKVQGRAA